MPGAFTIYLLEAKLIFFRKSHFPTRGGHCNYSVGVFLLVLLIYFIARLLTCTQGESLVMTGTRLAFFVGHSITRLEVSSRDATEKTSPATTQIENSGFLPRFTSVFLLKILLKFVLLFTSSFQALGLHTNCRFCFGGKYVRVSTTRKV